MCVACSKSMWTERRRAERTRGTLAWLLGTDNWDRQSSDSSPRDDPVITRNSLHIQCESKKSPPGDLTFFHFFHKRLRICNRFFTHLLKVPIFARLQIFIQLSPISTKLCHIKRNYAVHIICAKCPKRTKTRTFRRLRKSLIAFLIVVCGKSL